MLVLPNGVQAAVQVQDGDSFLLNGQGIRLYGIDAPEKDQTCTDDKGQVWGCGLAAKQYLEHLVDHNPVTCAAKIKDTYQRLISVCHNGSLDIGEQMVKEGWAVAYTRYSTDYVDAEKLARQARRGIWSGQFETPEKYRHAWAYVGGIIAGIGLLRRIFRNA
jgi:endonuclease YncB( thermonuclease family)